MQIKLLTKPDEFEQCFAVVKELRPHLNNVSEFVKCILKQQDEGYQIAVCCTSNDEVASYIGFRIMNMLACGKIIYIDDLATYSKFRSLGYGRKLLDYVSKLAKQQNCRQLQLDSGFTRYDAHRLYLNYGFKLIHHHFILDL